MVYLLEIVKLSTIRTWRRDKETHDERQTA
jgi:hypothetical protein